VHGLFFAMWTSDLFMKRVQENGKWTLMCLANVLGCMMYMGGVCILYAMKRQAKEEKQSKQELWEKILESQIETGTPYMLYKDAVNRKSNQKNLGTIRSSNLCTEIMDIPLLMRLLFVI
jgi:ribonucleoside-diphosphate reductase alpha chain